MKMVNRLRAVIFCFVAFALSSSSVAAAPEVNPSEIHKDSSLGAPRVPVPISPYLEEESNSPRHELFEETSENSSRFFQEFLHMLSILGVMIAVLLLASWFLKRLVSTKVQQGNAASMIKIIERRGLTAKTAIYLIEIDEQRIAIAESSNGATLLCHLPSAATAAAPQVPPFEHSAMIE
jgi:flagellar biogenesis protein FliO